MHGGVVHGYTLIRLQGTFAFKICAVYCRIHYLEKQAKQRKEDNRLLHSKPGSVVLEHERQSKIVRAVE